jgi:hypothetical protein
MAAKTWNKDFRYPAIQASIRAFGDDYRDDPFRYPGSFCVPVAEKPVAGWTPGRTALIALVIGFAMLVGGALLGSTAERRAPGADRSLILALAATCSLGGMVTFFLPATLERRTIRWLTRPRGDDLIDRSPRAKIMSAELSNGDRSKMKISVDGDDHVLVLFDGENRRLMIEGIGARYQIRAEDVERIGPFEFLNYLGVEIVYRTDEETSLHIAIARVSILLEVIRQVPILFFLRKRLSNKPLAYALQTLQVDGH